MLNILHIVSEGFFVRLWVNMVVKPHRTPYLCSFLSSNEPDKALLMCDENLQDKASFKGSHTL